MTDAINTQNRLRNIGVSDTRNGSSDKTGQAGNNSATSKSSGDSAIVDLSNSTLVQELGEQIKNLPEVNEARVEAIKQSLANGEYEADAEVIARKYTEIEKLLP